MTNELVEQVLDKIAKEFSEGNCKTWKNRKSFAFTDDMKTEDKKVERAVVLALQEKQAEVEKVIEDVSKAVERGSKQPNDN